MSNSLNRDIHPGEEVVIKVHLLKLELRDDPDECIFVYFSGFGLSPETAGTKIFGLWKKTAKMEDVLNSDFIRGYDIDPAATEAHQQKLARAWIEENLKRGKK